MRAILAVLILFAIGCTAQKPVAQVVELKAYPMDSMDGVITKSGAEVDPSGSIKFSITEPTVIRLAETGDLDVESATVIYKARVRTENLQGKAYLEMLCSFPGKGEFFSRGLDMPLTGTVDWTTLETPFFLNKGENPDNIKLNIVVEGSGIVWVDDVKVIKGPLK